MPRYMIERTFPDGLIVPVTADGAQSCLGVVAANAKDGVTWVHSYVSQDKKKSFCIYDGPDMNAIRHSAGETKLPIDRITEVRVLDPYFYV